MHPFSWVLPIATGLLLSSGSAAHAARPSAPAIDNAELELKLQVDVTDKSGGQPHAGSVGETLAVGDMLAMRVELTRAAYLYVAQIQPSGAPELLYPGAEPTAARPLEAGTQLRIPSAGAFAVDAAQPEGRLFVAASQRALPAAQVRELALKAAAALTIPRDAPPAPPPSRPPPQPIKTTERQIKPVDQAASAGEPAKVLRAQAPGGGVASVLFSYRVRVAPPAKPSVPQPAKAK